MERRVFLGWDEPLLGKLVDWLWTRRDRLPRMLVVVPTAQGGRRLREALAERGACLAPRVVTPGWFMRDGVSPTIERVAWVEAIEGVRDWEPFAAAFPQAPGVGEAPGWGLALAKSLHGVERVLREGGWTMGGATARMAATGEAERWQALRGLWEEKQRRLRIWGIEEGETADLEDWEIVVAGVADLAPRVVAAWSGRPVTVLVAAPDGEAEAFDEWGRPVVGKWAERVFEWPENGGVEVVADPLDQAREALRRVAAEGRSSGEVALGSADEETAEALVRVFREAGWSAFNPAGASFSPVRAWWQAWRAWLSKPEAGGAIDLLGCEESRGLVGPRRVQRVRAISRLRDGWMVRRAEDVRRVVARPDLRDVERELAELALGTLELLERARAEFSRKPWVEAVRELMDRVDEDGRMDAVREWLAEVEGLAAKVGRGAAFWLEVMVEALPEEGREPPDERVVDVQGWLELLHEPGAHLVVAGMNEGKVPAAGGADPWLPEGTRRVLELAREETRVARDAYLLRAICEARRKNGRVDLLAAKSSLGGDALLPSRLLLSASEDELPARVERLFREIEPPDAGMEAVLDWKWRLGGGREIEKLSVTALRDYLACPTRFFLKHVRRAGSPEPERVEWNARDYGTVAHEVLERWGLDEEARDFNKAEALEAWLWAELERVVAQRFGDEPPLAVRIQTAGLRQRLGWFARWQACQHVEGWRVEAVERKFSLQREGVELRGTIDRIDVHAETGERRVLDYKTHAKEKQVEAEHRIGANRGVLPAHLEGVAEVLCEGLERGKPVPKRWINLQVPLYAAAVEGVTALGYFILGATEKAAVATWWPEFGDDDRESALRCADWVLRQVKAGVFGPPAERVKYDDYQSLAMGLGLADVVEGLEQLERAES